LGFGVEKLTLGGIMPVLKMWRVLAKDARKAAISVWLWEL
jgi:hypothetical protein